MQELRRAGITVASPDTLLTQTQVNAQVEVSREMEVKVEYIRELSFV